MRLCFLRHGKAEPRAGWHGDDRLRPLTSVGEEVMRREAKALRAMGLAPEAIVSSPLARAQRTAEIVAGELGMADRVVLDDRLGHGFRLAAVADLAAEHRRARELLLVGHEPDMGVAVSELVGGGRVVLRKGGLARVDVEIVHGVLGDGELVWLLTPALLGVR